MVKKLVFILLAMLLTVPMAEAAGGTFNYELPSLSVRLRTMPLALSIMGPPMATEEQCVQYLLRRNPLPLLTVSPRQLVAYYYEEATREGIRPDVAFAQALHETGNFRYGGDVVPLQNNYCGLGTTGGGVKGAWFETAQIGVRAQIQHLVAYTATRRPVTDIVDPRYELVRRSANFAQAVSWTDLNGRWAVPGTTYGQKIMTIHQRILEGE
ncbi:glucosaminidase domain-containing protein [Propionispora hippei]|uniref:Mannosyl-glycoprotein endo-beta-N-acetylglucosaminidase n=1 Tax=Propionispora hippei DSM 15287 TaxID=1123003 RepID=A0A1M6K9W5_9FIRM|nr:glucosaminidase domain-containing protein [Propionispora hippei]SHJ55713.1 Mannosyl-glycoprotein endo-beta-N-acetylglucosaminidase [Propionispora hippei DSM 15287]